MSAFKENLSDHKGHILQSCLDCLLWTDTFRNGDITGRYILQFSKFCPQQIEHSLLGISNVVIHLFKMSLLFQQGREK